MKRSLLSLCLSALLLLTGCAGQPQPQPQAPEARLTIVTTTYPVYLMTRGVTAGAEGVAVLRLDTGSTGCLHDYTLTVNDMKKIEGADVLALSGAGLEEFMEDALATSSAPVIDCSEGVELLENLSHHHHDHDHSHDGHDHGHFDPHYWMDPGRAVTMGGNLASGLALADPDNAHLYAANAARMGELLDQGALDCADLLEGIPVPRLITFHDGFRYFAHAFGMELLESIEEEAGSEASAKEILEISALVREHDLPGVFTEVNGSDATAQAIARETGCTYAQLSMMMDGPTDEPSQDSPDHWVGLYLEALKANILTVAGVFAGE